MYQVCRNLGCLFGSPQKRVGGVQKIGESVLNTAKHVVGLWKSGDSVLTTTKHVAGL